MLVEMCIEVLPDYRCDRPIEQWTSNDLTYVPEFLHEQFKQELKHGNLNFFKYMNKQFHFKFVWLNPSLLLGYGIYEKALVVAYINSKNCYPSILPKPEKLRIAFEKADRKKLIDAGDPLPDSDTKYTLYRGVCGGSYARTIDGYSWTQDFEIAKRDALSTQWEEPIVYEAKVDREQILFYQNRDGEREFIVDIPEKRKLKSVWRGPFYTTKGSYPLQLPNFLDRG